ncbi:MAG: histidine phosphatase family protein [Acidimicrobiia bacterium]
MAARVVLVRHGQPDGSWGQDPDPGLDELGHAQARAVAEVLAPLGPLPVIVSPLRRTRDTAAPLVDHWGVEPIIEAGVGELVAPSDPQPDHATWLRALMSGTGADAPEVMDPFRDRVVGAIRTITTDSIVVSHFLAINAVVGAATGDDRVLCFRPAHCSCTVVEVTGGQITLVELPK